MSAKHIKLWNFQPASTSVQHSTVLEFILWYTIPTLWDAETLYYCDNGATQSGVPKLSEEGYRYFAWHNGQVSDNWYYGHEQTTGIMVTRLRLSKFQFQFFSVFSVTQGLRRHESDEPLFYREIYEFLSFKLYGLLSLICATWIWWIEDALTFP